jgi:GNAT superfamily N-acetyltransferase
MLWTAPRRVESLSLVLCSSARRVGRRRLSSVMSLHGVPLFFVRINPHSAAEFDRLRLRTVGDCPSAFAPNYASLSAGEWERNAGSRHSNRGFGLMAQEVAGYCGLAIGLADEHTAGRINLVALWVAPERRLHGIGRQLVEGVKAWSRGSTHRIFMSTSPMRATVPFDSSPRLASCRVLTTSHQGAIWCAR